MEAWKDIPGFEGLYQVSNLGRVRSLDREIKGFRHGELVTVKLKGRILKSTPDGNGYLKLRLGRDSPMFSVHKLVLLAFVGPCPPGEECLHENDIGTDNRLTNLRWNTRIENRKDQVRNGGRHLTFEQAKDIRWLRSEGATITSLAIKYSLSRWTIRDILKNRIYVK